MTEALPLDIELLDESFEIDEGGLRELIDMYFVQAEQTITGLEAAIEDGRSDDVRHLAHKLAGSSAVCGATAMIGPLRMLEHRGRENQLSDAETLVDTIAQRFELCRRLLSEYLEQKGA